MLDAVAPLKHTLDLNTRLFLNCLEGLTDEDALKRPSNAVNHAAFISLHLVDVRHYLGRGVGLDSSSPFESLTAGAKGLEDIASYPPLTELRSAFRSVSEALSNAIMSLSGDDISKSPPATFPIDSGDTVLGMIAFLVQHDGYHVGQLALLRRFLGYEAMSYR